MCIRDRGVGGGNSAVSDAVLLSRIAKKVIIVHRRDTSVSYTHLDVYKRQVIREHQIEPPPKGAFHIYLYIEN